MSLQLGASAHIQSPLPLPAQDWFLATNFLIPGVPGPTHIILLSCTLKPGAITRSHWLRERPTSHVCLCSLLVIDIWLRVCGGQMHVPCHQGEEQDCGHPNPEQAALWRI